jgi:hypothetical protein
MWISTEEIRLQNAYRDLNYLIHEGFEYFEALQIVKREYQLEASIQIELWYQNKVNIVYRADETIETLANDIQQHINTTSKQTFIQKIASWLNKN